MKLLHDTAHLAITYWKSVHNYLGTSEGMFIGMFIGQTVSVSWFNYLHLREGFFAEIGLSKKSCQAKSRWSYWGNKLISIDTSMWRQYLNIHRSGGFGILIKLSSSERGLFRRGGLNQEVPFKRRSIDYTEAADLFWQTAISGHDRLYGRPHLS
jgi:hypothetical protein